MSLMRSACASACACSESSDVGYVNKERGNVQKGKRIGKRGKGSGEESKRIVDMGSVGPWPGLSSGNQVKPAPLWVGSGLFCHP